MISRDLTKILLVLMYVLKGAKTEVDIDRAPVAIINKDTLFLECRPADSGVSFVYVNSIQFYRNSTAILGTVASELVSIVYNRVLNTGVINWQDLSVRSRANATGNVDSPSSSYLRIEIAPEDILCIDGAAYRCEISGSNNVGSVVLDTGETTIEIQSLPNIDNPLHVEASDGTVQVNSTFGRYDPGVTLELTCNASVGKPPRGIVWCIDRDGNEDFMQYTDNVTTSGAEEFGNCQNQRISTLLYTLTDEDDTITFLCQDDSNTTCAAGLAQTLFTASTRYEETTEISTDITTFDLTTELETSDISTDVTTNMFTTDTYDSETPTYTPATSDASSAGYSTDTDTQESMTLQYMSTSVGMSTEDTMTSELMSSTMISSEASTTTSSIGEQTSLTDTVYESTSNNKIITSDSTDIHSDAAGNTQSTRNTYTGTETSILYDATTDITTMHESKSTSTMASTDTTTSISTQTGSLSPENITDKTTQTPHPESPTTAELITQKSSEAATSKTNSILNTTLAIITSSTPLRSSTFYQSGQTESTAMTSEETTTVISTTTQPTTTTVATDVTTATEMTTTANTSVITTRSASSTASPSTETGSNGTTTQSLPTTTTTSGSTTTITTTQPSSSTSETTSVPTTNPSGGGSTTAAPQRYSNSPALATNTSSCRLKINIRRVSILCKRSYFKCSSMKSYVFVVVSFHMMFISVSLAVYRLNWILKAF